MDKDNLYTADEARPRIMNGILKAASAVGVTMGTSGSNSLIQAMENPGYGTTNDGLTILQAIKFADPLEEMGRQILLEAVQRANGQSGDGSSTATVLCAAILEEGMKHIRNYCSECQRIPKDKGDGIKCPSCGTNLTSKIAPMAIKRGLEACIPLIEKSINEQKKEITVDEVGKVASISAEDEKIGAMVQEIYQKIGKEGIIYWDVSKTPDDFYTLGAGLTMHGACYATPYMCDIDPQTGNFLPDIRLKDSKVLLTRQRISAGSDFNELFVSLSRQDIQEIVIFCDDIDPIVLGNLITTRVKKGFRAIVVKMPIIYRDEWWEDLAHASGAKLIDLASGLTIKTVTEEHLGTFGHIAITKEDVFVDGIKDMTTHIKHLEENKEENAVRIARLNTKTARYFVGAQSESALYYKRLKVEDAISAASCALENGVVAGGGAALLNVLDSLTGDDIGRIILREALQEPAKRIMGNAGLSESEHKAVNKNWGLDTRTMQWVDMFEANILDPADVVLNAVRNAIGVAASILTIGTVVLLPPPEPQIQPPQQAIMR